jgi:hypothetical protein
MKTVKTLKNVILATIITSFLVPAISMHAALPQENEISKREQSMLDEQLFHAIGYGKLARIRTYLKLGANPNARNEYYYTPLHCTCRSYLALEAMQLLILAGADLNAPSRFSNTFLHFTVPQGKYDAFVKHKQNIRKELIKANVDLNVQDDDGETALMYAVKHLLDPGAVLNTTVIEELVAAGADETIKNNEGLTALDLARQQSPLFPPHSYTKRLERLTRALEKRERMKEQCEMTLRRHEYISKGPFAAFFPQVQVTCDPVIAARQRAIAATALQTQRAWSTRTKAIAFRAARLLKK